MSTVDVCSESREEEIICEGVVSATLMTCPNAGTVIGAALGFSGLVQLAVLLVVVMLYLALRAITGQTINCSDILKAASSPGMTTDQAASLRMEAGEVENVDAEQNSNQESHNQDEGDNKETESPGAKE